MKKLRLMIVLVVAMFLFNIKVFAATATLSVSSNSVSVGDKFTVYVNMKSSAAWNIHVLSDGPVSGCVINQADTTADAMDTTKTFSVECITTGEGVINISLSGDVTSANDGVAVNISDKKSVTVNKKSNNNSNNGGNTSNKVEVKSKNNKIKELSVDGYELKKINENSYELSVSKDIANINIKAIAEDSKANITGIGKKELKDGENNFDIVVTSESGLKNVINIKVLRKTEYNIDDLNTLLNNTSVNNVNIVIDSNTEISKDILNKIKDSKKKVNFNVLDENKKNIYSWILDGSKIDVSNNLKVTINNKTEYNDKILKVSNYADGMFVRFLKENKFSDGITVKLYVGDKYNNDNELNIYSYDVENNELNLVKKVLVEDSYIYLDNLDNNNYFITMSSINDLVNQKENNNMFFVILSIIELLVIICLIIIFMCKRRNNLSNNIDYNMNNNQDLSSNNVNTFENINNDINSIMYNSYSDNNINTMNNVINNNKDNNGL